MILSVQTLHVFGKDERIRSYLESASRDGRETFHLYDAKRRMSAQDEFILYDFLGWMVSFCTVSISRASSS